MKNRDADLTNPNIYHCIDEKVDHVYDEIKHKDAKEFGKYLIFVHAFKLTNNSLKMILLTCSSKECA